LKNLLAKNLLALHIIVWLIQLSEYVDIPTNASREISDLFSLCGPINPKSLRASGAFLYVINSLHSCIYLAFFPDIIRSCDREFVFRSGASATRCRGSIGRKCHLSIKEKGTVAKAKSLFVGGLEICLKKSSHKENAQTLYFYISKSRQMIGCLFFKALSLMGVFNLTIHNSTQTQ